MNKKVYNNETECYNDTRIIIYGYSHDNSNLEEFLRYDDNVPNPIECRDLDLSFRIWRECDINRI